MDEGSELSEKTFYGAFSELRERSPSEAQTLSKEPAESSKINKKPLVMQFFSKMKSSYRIYSVK